MNRLVVVDGEDATSGLQWMRPDDNIVGCIIFDKGYWAITSAVLVSDRTFRCDVRRLT